MEEYLNDLEALGWNPWKKDEFNVYKKATAEQKLISFNEDTFKEEFLKSEKDQFWAKHRVNIIKKYLDKKNVIWEIGAGNGNVAIPLKEMGVRVIAVEPLELGCRVLSNSQITVFNATLEDLNLPDNSIETIGMFDLLGHVFHYEELLIESRRVLTNDGKLILLLPAYEWLYSDYDLAIKQVRRFSRKQTENKLRELGFEIAQSKYIFSLLMLPALFLRWLPYKLGRRTKFSEYEKRNSLYLKIGKFLNPVLKIFFKLEESFDLKFGLSIFIVAHKS